MNKLIIKLTIALVSCNVYAEDQKISIKGLEIGLSKAEVSAITGTQRSFLRGFAVAGVSGDLAVSYGNNGLNLAMFVFSPNNFITIKEAYAEKYKGMQCVESEVQNALGAKFMQNECTYKDGQGIIELVKYMDVNRSSLKIKSIEKLEEELKEIKEKKKDI